MNKKKAKEEEFEETAEQCIFVKTKLLTEICFVSGWIKNPYPLWWIVKKKHLTSS